MTEKNKDLILRWIKGWRDTGQELERMRHERIRQSDTSRAIQSLDDAFKVAILHHKPKPYSGLVEQQELFKSLRQ
ncbi:MAG: hypothetical protein JRF30_11430 [Deltaproteobacteria bacterium]|jgi:hypothetical protein|nr:hypothetical protein [Deltaproteobacteria bacterium]MBW2331499.1 hypothetical protein [Deltaproteobacteria bacterium]